MQSASGAVEVTLQDCREPRMILKSISSLATLKAPSTATRATGSQSAAREVRIAITATAAAIRRFTISITRRRRSSDRSAFEEGGFRNPGAMVSVDSTLT